MTVDPRAGQPATQSMLANVPRLVAEYYTRHPDPAERDERVSFGTSGHRGSSLKRHHIGIQKFRYGQKDPMSY